MVNLCKLRQMSAEDIGSREAELCLKRMDRTATSDELLELQLLGKVKAEKHLTLEAC